MCSLVTPQTVVHDYERARLVARHIKNNKQQRSDELRAKGNNQTNNPCATSGCNAQQSFARTHTSLRPTIHTHACLAVPDATNKLSNIRSQITKTKLVLCGLPWSPPLGAAMPQEPPQVTPQEPRQVTPQEQLQVTPQKQLQVTPQEQLQVTPQEQLQVTSQEQLQVAPPEQLQVTPQEKPQVAGWSSWQGRHSCLHHSLLLLV